MSEPEPVVTRRRLSFAQTINVGYAAIVALTAVMAVIALVALQHVVERKDQVIDTDAQVVLDVQKLVAIRDGRAAANRGYLISGLQKYLDEQYRDDTLFAQQLTRIRDRADTTRTDQLVAEIAQRQAGFVVLDRAPVTLRQQRAPASAVTEAWNRIDPQRVATADSIDTLLAYQQSIVDARKAAASASARFAIKLIVGMLLLIVLAAALLATGLTRMLRARISGAVGAVQTSSADLQNAANEQATGAKEQAVTVNEISTTTTELLASARQIAESAQRVAQTAQATAQAGRAGLSTVVTAQATMTEIRDQIDTVVNHMTQLGEKSARIGTVVDIVSELAEQTNILAINATIEASGSSGSSGFTGSSGTPEGAGRRFTVVAEEIRKLADRTMHSAKEIRELIEVVRSAVHTTMMATEIGSKAVDLGSAHVQEVARSFERIDAQVRSTTEAAREIELSSQQQTVAVEQVNLAIGDAAEQTRTTETGAGRTLQTASRLTSLSSHLRELVSSSE